MKSFRFRCAILIVLVLVFSSPGFFAYLFYTHPTWLSGDTTNRGTFIKPPILLRQLGVPLKWRLLYWSPVGCDSVCKVHLDQLARVRLALGRYLYDVDVCLVLGRDSEPPTDSLLNILRENQVSVIKLSADMQADLPILSPHPGVFIANPNDYLVLRYQLTDEPDDIFHDIKQLVKEQ